LPQVVPLRTDVPLRPAPIEPSWIIEGNPVAHNCVLSRGSDGLALTIPWECTEGAFDWHYDYDETVHFLEGSAVIESATMAPTRFGPGDVLFFPCGAKARWKVERKVRKLAFFRTPAPAPLMFAINARAKLTQYLKRIGAEGDASRRGLPAPRGFTR
jgi:uncharacterized protein